MAWLQLTLETDKATAYDLGEFLEDIGAVSVSLTDAGDDPVLEPLPGETPLWKHTTAIVLFTAGTDPRLIEQLVKDRFNESVVVQSSEPLEDREWLNEWKRDKSPKQYGERLWVYPWDTAPDDDSQISVFLEPGLAFGTGDHATTAMCLRWLDQENLEGLRIMDYGCGSGLLAIAALKLGAASATGIDIDPQALTATAQNAEQNNVSSRIELREVDAATTTADEPYDIVLANILSGILIELSSTLSGLTRAGGQLVLTGILKEQAPAVIQAYAGEVALSVTAEQDGWVMLSGTK